MGKVEYCIVCKGSATRFPAYRCNVYDCSHCGKYVLFADIPKEELEDGSFNLAKLGYALYHGKLKITDDEGFQREYGKQLQEISRTSLNALSSDKFDLPTPLTQTNNLLKHAGKEHNDSGTNMDFGDNHNIGRDAREVRKRQVQFIIGARSCSNVFNLVRNLVDDKFIRKNDNGYYSLTTAGLKRYQDLEGKAKS